MDSCIQISLHYLRNKNVLVFFVLLPFSFPSLLLSPWPYLTLSCVTDLRGSRWLIACIGTNEIPRTELSRRRPASPCGLLRGGGGVALELGFPLSWLFWRTKIFLATSLSFHPLPLCRLPFFFYLRRLSGYWFGVFFSNVLLFLLLVLSFVLLVGIADRSIGQV